MARELGQIIGDDGSVEIIMTDNTKEVLDALDNAIIRVLTMIGIKIERYAKKLCPTGTPESTGIKGYRGGTLKNSITFQVDRHNSELVVGTNVEYAPYVELGTGPYFEPPPEWEDFSVPTPSGEGSGYVYARPFLRPAIEDHYEQYQRIIKNELENA